MKMLLRCTRMPHGRLHEECLSCLLNIFCLSHSNSFLHSSLVLHLEALGRCSFIGCPVQRILGGAPHVPCADTHSHGMTSFRSSVTSSSVDDVDPVPHAFRHAT